MIRSRPLLVAAVAAGAFLRLWRLDAVGFNSDEAVYAGQAAALAGDPELSGIFPIFRAHPLLFHVALSALYRLGGVDDLRARLLVVGFGLCTVVATYAVGTVLWNRHAGALAALFLALLPYHVTVTRQVLLDGPMTLLTTAALGCLAVYASTRRPRWLLACAASLALAGLVKETAVVLLGSVVLFLAIAPELELRARDALLGLATLVGIVAAHPLALALAGGGGGRTARSYLAWQFLRRPNHDGWFYAEAALPALGPLLVVAAIAALWRVPAPDRWKGKLLVSWIAVPTLFFQLWPVKGFQYLLPIAPALALLAAGALARTRDEVAGTSAAAAPRAAEEERASTPHRWAIVRPLAAAVVAASLAFGAWGRIAPGAGVAGTAPPAGRLLAGTGGVPGGRAAGEWVRSNVPEGASLMTIGPSMANILQFYGGRRAYGLSVSSDPLRRNPAYQPIRNPDLALRRGDIQYVVWDRFSASRSIFFSERIRRYVEKYDGRLVHVERADDGSEPFVAIYEVRP